MPATSTRTRQQINFAVASGDQLAARLRAAEEATGHSRSLIARRVVEQFLDVWLAAQLRQGRIADEARAAALARIAEPAEPAPVGVPAEFQAYLDAAGKLLDARPGSADYALAMAELTPGAPAEGGSAGDVLLRLERMKAGA